MAGRKVQLIISVDDKDVEKVNKSVRNLGATLATIKKGKIHIDRSEVDRANASVSNLGTTIGTALGTIAGQAVSEISRQLMDGARAVLEYSSRLEQTKIGFTTLMGSASAAEAHLKSLRDFANSTPFRFEDLTTASRRLQNVGLEASKVIPVMRDIGNAAAAAGASSAELDMITLAFSQILAKGKLSAEEVNQLAERGLPIWKMLSDQLGLTKAEIIKMSEEGKISSEVFMKAFQRFSQANYGDAMEKQSHTFAGAMSSIRDIALEVSSEAFKPFFAEISKFADNVSRSLQEQQPKAKEAGVSFGFAIGEATGAAFRRGFGSGGGTGGTDSTGFFTVAILQLMAGFKKGKAGFDATSMMGGRQFELDPITNTLKLVQNEIDKTKSSVKGIPSLKTQLDADEAEKRVQKLKDMISDLTGRIAFFGQESQVAATKQKLINDGITDFNTGLGASAISLAATLDRLQANAKAAKEYQDALTASREYIERARSDANFEIQFPKATELERFDRWVKDNARNFRELASEIAATRGQIQAAQRFGRMDENTSAISDAVMDLDQSSQKLSSFQEKLRQIGASFKTIKDRWGEDMSASSFQSQLGRLVSEYEKAATVIGDPAKTSAVVDADKALRGFLLSLEDENGLNIFGLATGELDKFIKALFGFKKALDMDELDAANKKFDDFKSTLQDQYDAAVRGNRELTVYEQTIRNLKESTEQLTPVQEAELLVMAKQTDAVKELNRQHAEMKEFFKTTLRYVFDGDFKGLLQNFGDRLKDTLADKLSDIFATSVLGFNPNQTNNPVAKPIVKTLDKTNEILNSILVQMGGTAVAGAAGGLGGILSSVLRSVGGGGSGMGPGGTPYYNPNFGSAGSYGSSGAPSGTVAVPPPGMGGGIMSQIFGAGGIFGSQGFGNNVGTYGGIGAIGNIVGGMIGGRVGGVISGAATGLALGAQLGSIIPGVGTAIGAAVGAIAGGLMGLFGGDPKRKQDHDENMPRLRKGFTDANAQFKEILADIRTLSVDPDAALSKARDLRSQIANGFGIQFLSKKYKKQSAALIAQQLAAIDREPDGLMAQIIQAAGIARGAADRNKRILPEFAGGVFISPEFRRYNGMLSGVWTGNDYRQALLADAEMVLNPSQQNNVRRAAGFDVFAGAGIPNYPRANPSRGLASGGIASAGFSSQQPQIFVQPRFTLIAEGVVFKDEAKIWLESDDGTRTLVDLVKKKKKTGDIS